MKTIKTILIDDEQAAKNILSSLLRMSFPNIEVVATGSSLLEGVKLIKKHKPDFVFLDVEMPNHAGYEIVNFIEKIDFHIVFVTAYDQYAIKAFEVNAIDYLLKPIDRARLATTIKKVELLVMEKQIQTDYHSLVKDINEESNKSIVFSESGKKTVVKIKEIIALQAFGAYSEIYISGADKLTVSKNLGSLEQELNEEPSFYRSHKSWLINRNHIQSYKKSDLTIELTNGNLARLSRSKKVEFEGLF